MKRPESCSSTTSSAPPKQPKLSNGHGTSGNTTADTTTFISQTVEVQGHRGFGDLEPHNTIRAFKAAAAHAGVASVEFDVQQSADSHLIVSHGAEVGESAVPTQTLAQLQASDLGHGERVPMLADVIDACLAGGLIMNVELKSADPAVVDKTIALLKEKKALPSCRVSSFHRVALQRVIEVAPGIPVGALFNPTTHLVDASDQAKGGVAEPTPTDFVSWFADHSVVGDSINLRSETVTAEEVQEAHRHGKQVLVWYPGVKRPDFEECIDEYKRVLALGVDIICCNRPDILAQMVSEAK